LAKNKTKKVDIRLNEELYNQLDCLMSVAGAKRSSWIRHAIFLRVQYQLEVMKISEEDVNEFIKNRDNGNDNEN